MAQTKQQIQSLLAQANSRPRHRFGQNFMIDGNLVRLVADSGMIQPGDLVIEVGPGTGTLTEELLARQASVVAVEIDRDLAALLRAQYESNQNFRLIEGDALAGKHAICADLLEEIAKVKMQNSAAGAKIRAIRLVANLPYNIASPLIIELLIAGADLLAFTVQKEVADRLRAAAGSDDYGPLSIMAQLLARVEVLRALPPQAFWPMPTIESALVRLTRQDHLGAKASRFSTFVHQIFSSRRKTLRNGLLKITDTPDDALHKTRIDGLIRPERLEPLQCLQLFNAIKASTLP
ncbi:MAG: 16S rRNA (adenine(1518)-N(6)/adenine(1519)-N(6))-dimethyltransferase RsmA [Planctomycetota bacterium]|nr:16S rRNA (adenine(1518)-N(6)/adenine(1519)-N(6))-dimethyltransferase RsmA [Planctomycetota bacterium]